MAGSSLYALVDERDVRTADCPYGARIVPDDHDDRVDARSAQGHKGPLDGWPTPERVNELAVGGLEPGALSRREDDRSNLDSLVQGGLII